MNSDDRELLRQLEGYIARRHDDLEKLIRWYFPADQHTRAIWVAWNLSGMDPSDLSACGTNQWGLFHVDPLSVNLPEREGWRLLDPIRNVAAAFKLWQRFGWPVFGLNIPDLPPAFGDEEVPF